MAGMITYRSHASFQEKFAKGASTRPYPEQLRALAGGWEAASRLRGVHAVGPRGKVADAPSARGQATDAAVSACDVVRSRQGGGFSLRRTSAATARKLGEMEAEPVAQVGLPYWSVESYLHHHGCSFPSRFDPGCYVSLTYCVDSHDVGRRRGGVRRALESLAIPVLVVGVDSDELYPMDLQVYMASACPRGRLGVIRTDHGHDGFLIHIDELNGMVIEWTGQALSGREAHL
jgi:homoserine acetyltransferase